MARTAYDVVIRPIITEQSMEDVDIKKYAFEVAKDANKIEIKNAIEEIFGVTVIKVTTTHMRPKEKRQGQYPAGKTASWKKAVVKLSADSKNIELFEGMA
jgi:large subunit ribosomal protein L23